MSDDEHPPIPGDFAINQQVTAGYPVVTPGESPTWTDVPRPGPPRVTGPPAVPVRRARRSHRWPRRVLIILTTLIGLLVAADFGARAFAEHEMAIQIQKQGISKPDVSIGGFPFLTQVIERDFTSVNVSWTNLSAGPVTIDSIRATLQDVRVNTQLNGARVGHLTGTVRITFDELSTPLTSDLGSISPLGAGLSLRSAGPDEVTAGLDLVVTSGSATWKMRRLSGNRLELRLVNSSGNLPSSLLGAARDITLPLGGLPLEMQIQNLSITPGGIVGAVTARNVTFGG